MLKSVVVLAVLTLAASACSNTATIVTQTNSMEDTIQIDAELTIDRDDTDPERSDIITHIDPRLLPDMTFVRRVIGLPNETIDGRPDGVYVNGRLLEEPYVKDGNPGNFAFAPITLRSDEYFVMGDNRDDTFDSRHVGPTTASQITGTVTNISNP